MKRDRILEASLELFVNEGFHGASTASIANKARVANGTLFHYFASKEELVIELYLSVKDNFLIQITENYRREDEFGLRLTELTRSIIRWAIEFRNEYRYIRQFVYSPFFNQLSFEQKMRHEHFFHEIISEGKTQKMLKDLPAELLIQLYLSQIYSLIEYVYDHPGMLNETGNMKTIINGIPACLYK
jgi:AcrR family transcriptional regulator